MATLHYNPIVVNALPKRIGIKVIFNLIICQQLQSIGLYSKVLFNFAASIMIMKNTIFAAILFATFAFVLNSCDRKGDGKMTTDMVTNSETASGKENIPVSQIKFDSDTFNFGTIEEGEKVSHSFKFTNTGTNDLIILNAKAGCGCTVPSWPKEPIAPGKSGVIDVVFNSEGKPGKANKEVTVYANTEPANPKVVIRGFVKAND